MILRAICNMSIARYFVVIYSNEITSNIAIRLMKRTLFHYIHYNSLTYLQPVQIMICLNN